MGRAWILCKKLFSLSLVFNALLTIACCVGILAGFYWYYNGWQPFAPWLLTGNLLWVAIAAAALNIFPSAMLGRKLHTGRFLFHHYFYGFLVLGCAIAFVAIAVPQYFLTIFLVNDTAVAVNVGRFFLLGGFTLVLDDLPDVSRWLESRLNSLKAKAYRGGKVLVGAQLVCGTVTLYIFGAVTLAVLSVPEWFTAANIMLMLSTLITAVTSFIFVKKGVWDGDKTD